MSPVARRNLLAAPELLVVDLVDDALAALIIAIELEHPTLDDDLAFTSSRPMTPPSLRRARVVTRRARRLRRALRAYVGAVNDALHMPDDEDLPF